MVAPEARREAVEYVRNVHGLSERQACRLIGISRSVRRYRRRSDRNVALRQAPKELASKKRKWGCPLLFKQLKREGWQVNHKRVERLYREEGLALRRRRRGKRIVRERRKLDVVATTYAASSLSSGTKVISTFRFGAAAMRLSITSEWPS